MTERSDESTSQARANLECAATLINALVVNGLKGIVISPGSRNTPLVLAAADHPQLQTWSVLDERSAGFFALGMARASQRPVAVLCTSGSAGANYFPSVVEAKYSNVPLVILTADRPDELHNCGAPQTMPQNELFGSFVVHHQSLPAPSVHQDMFDWERAGCDAMAAAQGHPLQPVHLNLAFRKPLWMWGVRPNVNLRGLAKLAPRKPKLIDSETLKDLAADLSSVERGLIYFGPMADIEEGLGEAVAELAKTLRWPVLCEAASGLRFGGIESELQVSAYQVIFASEFGHSNRPDYVLHFGGAPTSRCVGEYFAHGAIGCSTLVSNDGRRHDPHQRASRLLHSAYLPLVSALSTSVDPSRRATSWAADWSAAERLVQATIAPLFDDGDLWEGSTVRTVVQNLPPGMALHLANSSVVREADAWCAPTQEYHRVFSSRGMNGIDGTLSTAAGESVEAGPLVCVVGDLAALHDSNGLLLTASSSVTIVLVDNGGGGIFNTLPIAQHPQHYQRYFLTPQKIDWPALAAAYGLEYVSLDSLAGLAEAVQSSADGEGRLLHVRVPTGVNMGYRRGLDEAIAQRLGPVQ